MAAEIDLALKGIKLIQGQAKVSRSLLTHRGQDATQSRAIPPCLDSRRLISLKEKRMTDACNCGRIDSPIIFVFIPKKSREDLLTAIATFEAAQHTIQPRVHPPPRRRVGEERDGSRKKLAEMARNNLITEITGAAKVFPRRRKRGLRVDARREAQVGRRRLACAALSTGQQGHAPWAAWKTASSGRVRP